MTTQSTLRAFYGDPAIQAKYINRVQAHHDADEIAQGMYVSYQDDGRKSYCAVGCVLHDATGNHAAYETELGIPASLAFLEDRIFESLEPKSAKEWPTAFMTWIPLGADLSRVTHLFLAWLMDDPTYGVPHLTENAESKELALEVARRYRTGDLLDGPEAEALADRLARAARAAWAAWAARAAFVEASASELLRLLASAPVPDVKVAA